MKNLTILGVLLMTPFTQIFSQADDLFDETYDFSKGYSADPPQAFVFDQYGKTPVNYYNGSVNINIPLLSIPTQGVGLNLSASYSTHGVAVAQTASEIGIDWNLNIGGAISREIRGSSDLTPAQSTGLPSAHETNVGNIMSYYFGWLHSNHNPIVDIVSSYPSSNPNAGYHPYNGQPTTTNFDKMVNDIMRDEEYDTEPDIFTLSINGVSATFFYDQDKNLVINSEQELDIQYPSVDNGEWIITDGYGNTYYFGEDPLANSKKLYTEWSVKPMPNHNGGFKTRWDATQWKIRKILTAEGEEVNFTYNSYLTKQGMHNHTYVIYQQEFFHAGEDVDQPMSAFSYIRNWKNSLANVTYTKNDLKYQLKFYYGDRTDEEDDNHLFGFKQLNSVELLHGNNELLQNKVEFVYFNHPGRLWLSDIVLKGRNETIGKEYSFEYENKDLIPPNLSHATDYFGYFNGQANNSGLPPENCPFLFGSYSVQTGIVSEMVNLNTTNLNTYDPSTGPYYLPNDNKQVDLGTALYGYLNKITYPTGGYTEYEYEVNTYDPPAQLSTFPLQGAGIRIKTIKDFTDLGVLSTRRDFNYTGGKLMSVPFYQFYTSRPKPSSYFNPNDKNEYEFCLARATLISSQPILPAIKTAQGALVGYDNVEVLYNNGLNGKEAYEFSNHYQNSNNTVKEVIRDDGLPIGPGTVEFFWYFGGIPYPRLQEKNGLLEITKTFEKNGGSFNLVSKTENLYTNIQLGSVKGDMYKSPISSQGKDVVTAHDEFCNAGDYSNRVALMTHHHYNHPFEKWAINETITTEYTSNGNITSSQDFTYTNANKTLVRKIETQNSDQLTETTTFYYVDDLEGSTDPNASFVSSMINDHKVSLPIAQLVGSGSGMHKGVVQLYSNDGKLHQSYTYKDAPKGFYNFNISHVSNGEWELEANYTHDANGDIVMIEREHGIENSLVRTNNDKGWANCANAHYQDVAYSSFEDNQWLPASASQAYATEIEKYSGDYSLLVNAGEFGFSHTVEPISQDDEFLLSVKVKTPTTFGSQNATLIIQVLDQSDNQLAWLSSAITNTDDKWMRFEREVDLSNYSNTVKLKLELFNNNTSYGLYVDEVRFHPKQTQMTTYTKTAKTSSGLSSLVDARGYLQTFEYDDLGHLLFVKDEEGNIVQTNQYNYRP